MEEGTQKQSIKARHGQKLHTFLATGGKIKDFKGAVGGFNTNPDNGPYKGKTDAEARAEDTKEDNEAED